MCVTNYDTDNEIIEEVVYFSDIFPFSLSRFIYFIICGLVCFFSIYILLYMFTYSLYYISLLFVIYIFLFTIFIFNVYTKKSLTPRIIRLEKESVYIFYPGSGQFVGNIKNLKVVKSYCRTTVADVQSRRHKQRLSTSIARTKKRSAGRTP